MYTERNIEEKELPIEGIIDDFLFHVDEDAEEEKTDKLLGILARNRQLPLVREIMYDTGHELGRGSFGIAAALGTDRVVKFTSDPEEITTSAKLIDHDIPNVVPIHAVYRLPMTVFHPAAERKMPVGIIVMGYAEPLDTETDFARAITDLTFAVKHSEGTQPHVLDKLTRAEARARLESGAESLVDGFERITRRGFPEYQQVADAVAALADRGIYVSDVHAGNIGVTEDGVLQLFDLGISSAPRTGRRPRVLKNRPRPWTAMSPDGPDDAEDLT